MSLILKNIKKTTLILSLLTLISCGGRPTGWGVLYINDPDNNLTAGTVLPIYQESEIRNVFTAGIDGSDSLIEIDRWKLSYHEKEADAQAFSAGYMEYADIYAVTKKNGLSIREEADINSERIYKLRQDQTVKIIGRSNTSESIAGHEGYWYIVLTEDGSSGYCFDMNLNIYDRKAVDTAGGNVLDNPLLNEFLSKPFRPEYFREMIRENMIDLARFRSNYGIFVYPEENKVILLTAERNLVFDYKEIIQNNSGRFIFEGTSLQVEVRNENRIAVYYSINKQEHADMMVYIDNMDELIESEIERRDLLFKQLTELGTVSSSAYGRISFGENASFSWSNNKRLIPNVIPESAREGGRILLDYLPGVLLRENYDGVLSFIFDGVPGNGRVNFLFKLSDLGIKLVHAPAGDIEKNIIKRESPSPLIIFMSGAGE
ncbi:MAG: SH3 domain-containing protein [Spirochaetales bacterium]|nr:SH3 domain-containing protein [Spirochaetales bacterium]